MKRLLVGVASIAVLAAHQTHAQDKPVASSADQTGEEEIIVTAQKRSERLVDVPVSITTVSSEAAALAGPDSLVSLNKLVPGLYSTTPVYYFSPTIRGVGSTLSVSNESNAAIYIDGVYQPAQASNVFDLSSIAGIEVLKGPQGTVFGRNATGGAILVRTLDPSFEAEGNISVSYARFNTFRAKAYGNLPISETVAANLAVSYMSTDGYIHDLKTGSLRNAAETYGVRGKLLFEPSSKFNMIFAAAYSKFDDPTASSYQSVNSRNALSAVPGAGPIAKGRFELSHEVQDVIRTTAEEYSLHANYDTGYGTLSSITAVKRDRLSTVNDADNSYLPAFVIDFTFDNNTFTQEVNFTREGDDYSFVAGVYYFHNNKFYPSFRYNKVEFLAADITAEAWAGYADGTFEFGDLAIIAGIRYSTEHREMDNALLAHPLTPVAARGSRHIERTEDAWTPRFGLRYALSERSNIYAIFSRGFKSGAYNGTSITEPGVTPETIDAYEVGYKAAGEGFLVNLAAFYYDYTDIQVNTLTITNGVALNNTVNAAKAEIYGLEFDGTYDFSDAFSARLGMAYTHSEYTSFPNAPGYAPTAAGGYMTLPVNATGNAMVRAPRFQASLQLNYTVPIGTNTLVFTLSPSYTSKVYFDFANTLSQDELVLLDASIALTMENGVRVSVFGRNVTDEEYFTGLGYSTLFVSSTYGRPATYGVEISYEF